MTDLEFKKHKASDLNLGKNNEFVFEFKKTQRIGFRKKIYNISVFDSTSFTVCQVFLCSSRKSTFRYCFHVGCGFVWSSYSVRIGLVSPNCDQRNYIK